MVFCLVDIKFGILVGWKILSKLKHKQERLNSVVFSEGYNDSSMFIRDMMIWVSALWLNLAPEFVTLCKLNPTDP